MYDRSALLYNSKTQGRRRGGKKESFPTIFETLFRLFSPSPPFRFDILRLAFFLLSLSLSNDLSIRFFLFITRKRDRSPFRVVEQDSRGG